MNRCAETVGVERRAIVLDGIVQGVGFRPFVVGVAQRLGLRGYVQNRAGQVFIEAEGDAAFLDLLLAELTQKAPPLARIESCSWQRRPPQGEAGFRIEHSGAAVEGGPVFVSPDVATCADCLRELFDPTDRRFGYPFLNCTNCGPRLTIITGVPCLETVQRLLIAAGGLRGLQALSTTELQQLVAGISVGRVAQLKAAIELSTRIARGDRLARRQVKSPSDVADLLLLEMSHLDQEHLRTVLLDTKNRVQAISTVYIGSLNASMIRVGEVFKAAVRQNSAALIVAHNHPSGDRAPRSAR